MMSMVTINIASKVKISYAYNKMALKKCGEEIIL